MSRVDDVFGEEEHEPYMGLIGASRTSSSGSALFQSEVQNQSYITIRVQTASRRRSLHKDWVHGKNMLVEVHLSAAQWAELLTTLNHGDGVPCTIRHRIGDDGRLVTIDGPVFAPRLGESLAEITDAANELTANIRSAYQEVLDAMAAKKGVKEAVTGLGHQINNLPSNARFMAKSVQQHAEKVVAHAKAEVDAWMTHAVQRAGLEALRSGAVTPELPSGEDRS